MSSFNHLVSKIQCLFCLCSQGHYCPYHSSYRADKWICPSRWSFHHPSQLPGYRHFPLHGLKQDNESKNARIMSIHSMWLNFSCLELFDDFDQVKLCQCWVCQEQSRPFSKQPHNHHNYTVIIAKTTPSYGDWSLYFSCPWDSSIFTLMTQINKFILCAQVILANDGMFMIAGSQIAAAAAMIRSTPVVVCTGQFILTSLWNLYHAYDALDFGNPSDILGFEEGHFSRQGRRSQSPLWLCRSWADRHIHDEWVSPGWLVLGCRLMFP